MFFTSLLLSALFCSLHAMDHQESYSDPAQEFTHYWMLRGQQERAAQKGTQLESESQELLDNNHLKLDDFFDGNDFKSIADLIDRSEHYESDFFIKWLREKALLGVVPCLHWYLGILARKLAGQESLDVLSQQEREDLRFCIVLGTFRLRQDATCFENVIGFKQELIARAIKGQWKVWFEEFFHYEDDDLDLYKQTFAQVEEWFGLHEAQLPVPTWLCACSYSSIFRKILWLSVNQKSFNILTNKSNQSKIQEDYAGVLLYNKSIFKPLTALHQIFTK